MLKLLQIGRLPSTSFQQACNATVRQFSLSAAAIRLSRFKPNFRFTTQRRPVSSPKASEYTKFDVHTDQIAVRPGKDLWKAMLFTVGVGFWSDFEFKMTITCLIFG